MSKNEMANYGGGNKFMSVNLNKSYGHQHHYHHYEPNRARTGAGGGGGMVLLSRARSSGSSSSLQKKTAAVAIGSKGPKLSVPAPVNLPSLRKEHERLDSLGFGGRGAAGAGSGSELHHGSSGVGWNKPAAAVLVQEKEGGLGVGGRNGVDAGSENRVAIGVSKGSDGGGSVYLPPSNRLVGNVGSGPSSQGFSVAEKATVLRGEDFPLLRATLPAVSGSEKKQRDDVNQKQKQLVKDELLNGLREDLHLKAPIDMRPQLQSRNDFDSGSDENNKGENWRSGSFVGSEKDRKQEDYFPGPLPLVRLNPRSDWADDERDTRIGLTSRGRDHGFSKSEAYWDRDIDFPRPSVLPQKQTHVFDRWGHRDNDTGKIYSSEIKKVDAYGRDVRTPSREGREGNSWRVSSPAGNERNSTGARSFSLNRETTEETKYMPFASRDNAQGDAERRNRGFGQGGRQPLNNSQGPELNREHHGNQQYNRWRGETYQNSSVSKSSFTLSSKGFPVNDPIPNFSRGAGMFSKTKKPYLEDPFVEDFDGRDPFSGGVVGLVKKKKDVLKQTDFHDPVRESFEAELERVQKMQEQERLGMIKEQERLMELARIEEAERMRLAREKEEHQRKLELEAQEAAYRAEQEQLEAIRRAEEKRIAREEEKRIIFMEEERRKQAAKQKLLELEEKIAKRNAETDKANSDSFGVAEKKMLGMITDKDLSKVTDVGDWESRERTERITTSASSDSSGMNRSFEMDSRAHFSGDNSLVFLDRGKPLNFSRRDTFDNYSSLPFFTKDQEIGLSSPKGDAPIRGKMFSRKEFYGGPGLLPSRTYHKGGVSDPHMDDFSQIKGQRWNNSAGRDRYDKKMENEFEFHDNLAERYGDVGWGQGRSRGNLYPSYQERIYQNDADGLYSFGRSRYPTKQPRVFPPPTMTSLHRSSHKGENEHPAPSAFLENTIQYNHGEEDDSTIRRSYEYENSHQETTRQTIGINMPQEENAENEVQKLDKNSARCDSQSSLCISSPPTSPGYLSHDDLDESGDSSMLSAGEGKDVSFVVQANESMALPNENEKDIVSGSSILSASDDEEWTARNGDQLQEQEEYDEDEDGYEEEDEVHDKEDENINLTQEFEDMHLEEKGPTDMMDNLVLGFNEGVEVGVLNDEFEKSSRNEETNFFVPQISTGATEDQRSFDGLCSNEQFLQPVGCSQVNIDNSSKIFQDTEKTMQDFTIEPKKSPQTSAVSELTGHVNNSGSSVLAAQPEVPSPSGQAVMPELPVKLQFGLFSSPALIPSPVQAIQIGSIQMPIPLHSPFGPPVTHVTPPQPPLFQFGQLRYTSPISQEISPLASQPMSFVQNVGGPPLAQHIQDSSAHGATKSEVFSVLTDTQQGLLHRHINLAHGSGSKEGNLLPPKENADKIVKTQQGQGNLSYVGDNNLRTESGFQKGDSLMKNLTPLSNRPTRGLQGQPQCGPITSQSISKEKDFGASKVQGVISGGRRKKKLYTMKNSVSRSSSQAHEASRSHSRGFQKRPRSQRIEFRLRESDDKRQSDGLVSYNSYWMDDKPNIGGRASGARSGYRKQIFEYEGSCLKPVSSQDMVARSRSKKGGEKESSRKSQNISQFVEDVDVPLQSGVVRVFEQHGIQTPSDDDDFIEVRSKRQMLNDRREKREKEIKAKSRVSKMPRKLHSMSQNAITSRTSNKVYASAVGEASNNIRSDSVVATEGHGLANVKSSAGFNTPISSQPLPPIGSANKKVDTQIDIGSQTIKSIHTSALPVVSGGGKNLSPGLTFESKDKVLESIQTSLGSWGTSRINQQVMSPMQAQVDDAMKPKPHDLHSSVADTTNSVSEPRLPSSSILTKDTSFAPATSPINSLLAGEKIQFGAVTSPTVLPPNSHATSHGISPPGPCQSDMQIPHNFSAAEGGCSIFFDMEKHSNESPAHLEDCEAEAAASAVAVAAISNDEIVGNGPSVGHVANTESKSFGTVDIDGVSGDPQLINQSRAEESLNVTLPADLSIETPISLWPPLPSPQNSPSQMLSHVTGGQSPHFPFYEMNPMFGGPVFTFGPHDESMSTQSQPQKSSAPVSSSHGTWQPQSGVDSFYGPPTGFTGPFISPHGGITGVQGPPHMVIYNHFAPVGQFGQVGLSFMGTTFVPSGKQPDWKHNPASSAMGVSEGDISNLNMVSQGNPASVHASIQHLAPGSPLLPMTSQLTMFDASPFQSPDLPVQARWPHVPTSHLQSAPASMPLQQQAEGLLLSRFNHEPQVDRPLTTNRSPETRTPTPSDNGRNFPVATDATMTQLPDELGLVDSSNSTNVGTATESIVAESSSASSISDATSKTNAMQNGSRNSHSYQNTSKTQPSHQKNASNQHYSNSSGYNYQRGGGMSQKNSSGGEWSSRRMGYQGRSQSLGVEKSYPTSKLKQIYVAKQTPDMSKE